MSLAPLWYTQFERTAFGNVLATVWTGPHSLISGPDAIDLVGHRIVHGGPKYRAITRMTAAVHAAIAPYGGRAHAHNPASRRDREVVSQLFGGMPQLAVVDTAFH